MSPRGPAPTPTSLGMRRSPSTRERASQPASRRTGQAAPASSAAPAGQELCCCLLRGCAETHSLLCRERSQRCRDPLAGGRGEQAGGGSRHAPFSCFLPSLPAAQEEGSALSAAAHSQVSMEQHGLLHCRPAQADDGPDPRREHLRRARLLPQARCEPARVISGTSHPHPPAAGAASVDCCLPAGGASCVLTCSAPALICNALQSQHPAQLSS